MSKPRVFVTQPIAESALARLRAVAEVEVNTDSSQVLPKDQLIAGVKRADGKDFEVPITHGASIQGRAALQVSRINRQVQHGGQTAVIKFAKIVHFLETLP